MAELTDLHMHFGAVRALTGVSFVARDGAITGLLGANGAGIQRRRLDATCPARA